MHFNIGCQSGAQTSSSPPGVPSAGRVGPLGTYGIFVAASDSVGQVEDGAVPSDDLLSGLPTKWERRLVVRALVRERFDRDGTTAKAVRGCLHCITKGLTSVEVHLSRSSGRASLRNLQTCGYAWFEPVCAAKVTTQRRGDLETLVEWAASAAHPVGMGTFTFSHGPRRALSQGIDASADAWRYLVMSRAYRRLMAPYGRVAIVRGLEVTYGANGWHPHFHILFVFLGAASVDWTAFEAELSALWVAAAARYGLVVSADTGVKITATKGAIGDYIAKMGREPRRAAPWGVSDEMARANAKSGRPGARTIPPFAMLDRMIEDPSSAAVYGPLYEEYIRATRGRRQLSWSRGLRDLVGLGAEKTDEELAAAVEDSTDLLCILTLEDWAVVRAVNGQRQLLSVASGGDVVLLRELVEDMRSWS